MNMKSAFRTGLLAAALILLVGTGPADASNANTYQLGVFTGCQIADWHNEYSQTGGVSIGTQAWEFSSVAPFSTDTGMYQYYTSGTYVRAAARAGYGNIGAYAYKSNPSADFSATASASARFADTFTIGSQSLNGQTGHFRVYVDVDGYISGAYAHPGVSGGSHWIVQLTDSYASSVESWDWANNSGREDYSGFLRQDITFTYGLPFTVSVDFSVSAGAPFNGAVGVNFADYLNTMEFSLANSQVLDAAGRVVTDYTFTAASGHDYLGIPTVPEPASMLLLGLGLAGLAGFRRKMK